MLIGSTIILQRMTDKLVSPPRFHGPKKPKGDASLCLNRYTY